VPRRQLHHLFRARRPTGVPPPRWQPSPRAPGRRRSRRTCTIVRPRRRRRGWLLGVGSRRQSDRLNNKQKVSLTDIINIKKIARKKGNIHLFHF
jgi:hypothetical protein